MSVLIREPYPFDQSLYIWGAYWWGQIGEKTAALAENSEYQPWPMWDNTKADLDDQILICPDGVSRPPDSWALPWATQYRNADGVG